MSDLLWQKFQDPDLADRLRATRTRKLIEGNWWGDTYWGVSDGVGENQLGELLMRIRTKLLTSGETP
jgi:predicted NAD-dependent protein-ADP-ribosyltransferase YbiA (DUF1768 family)